MADKKLTPEEAMKQIAAQLHPGPAGSGYYELNEPAQDPLGRLFGKQITTRVPTTNYLSTLNGALGDEATKRLLPANLPITPEGQPLVSKDAYDQVMQAASDEKNNRILSPEESALTIGYWKEAAPALVPLAERIVQERGGLPEWLGKQGPSYRTKRSEYSQVQGFTEDGSPVEYDATTREWFVGGKQTPADKVGRLLTKTKPQMSNEQVNEVTNLLNAQSQLQEVQNLFDPKAVGPIEDKLLGFQELTGIKMPDLQGLSVLSDDKVKLRTIMASGINDYIKAITGAQMSEVEARRIMKALPKPGAADEAFLPALQEILKLTGTKLTNRLDVLETQDVAGISKLRALATTKQQNNTPTSKAAKKVGVSKVADKYGF